MTYRRVTFSLAIAATLITLRAGSQSNSTQVVSTLQTISIRDGKTHVVLSEPGQIEAPNWSRDGKTLLFTREGRLWSIPVSGGTATPLDIGSATHCTGSHGFSPDGKLLAISCSMPDQPDTRVYILPSTGGTPHMLTANPRSYFHSWSPDGKTILFSRPEHGTINFYAIPADGGDEKPVTTGTPISDDPDYSPDGKFIYFNSDRTGAMEIWRMAADGTHSEQLTFDKQHSWTPHPSPDGHSILFISYGAGATGHPANRPVTLRIFNAHNRKVRDLAHIVGGAGSDNVPNWSPDGKRFAYVEFKLLSPQ